MKDFGDSDRQITVTIKRKSKKKAGFEVEKRSDGFYYITKTPKRCTKISVGDRVLEINGTSSEDFKSQENANDLVDTLRIDLRAKQENENDQQQAPRGFNESFSNNDQSSSSFVERASIRSLTDESWKRGYVSKYKPDQRFMISVTNTEGDDYDLGVDFIEYKEGEIYVSDVNRGPFYDTALYRGDKILAINGKKIAEHLLTIDDVYDILYSKPKITLFVLRPRKNDKGYKWVQEMD